MKKKTATPLKMENLGSTDDKYRKSFFEGCKLAGIPSTRRQWTKFKKKEGSAYKALTS